MGDRCGLRSPATAYIFAVGAIAEMNEQLQNILPKTIHDKWTEYLGHRNRGLKGESKQSLTDVIVSLESIDKESLNPFVFYLTDLQRTEEEKIDYHLFEKIILPCLIDGMSKNLPTYHRRIAQFDQRLSPSNQLFSLFKTKTGYKNDYFEKADFYKNELEINPNDKIAVDGLLERIAWGLNYAIHELPDYGLLWDLDLFNSELQEFKKYLAISDKGTKWQQVLARWDFVSRTWQDYEANRDKYENYADYLKTNDLRLV